jgi:hypothetical protein
MTNIMTPALAANGALSSVGVVFCLFAWILASAALLIALCVVAVGTYLLLFHPLARVPGPRLAALSNVWQGLYVRNGRIRELANALHDEYGPVVRVGPNEVWFNSAESFRHIYRTPPLFTLSSPSGIGTDDSQAPGTAMRSRTFTVSSHPVMLHTAMC